MRRSALKRLLPLPVVLFVLAGCATDNHIRIKVDKPEFEYSKQPSIVFRNRPGALGLTQWYFHCRPEVNGDTQMAGPLQAVVTVRGVNMEIGLSIREATVDQSQAVAEHEGGHAKICLRIYKQAPEAAREACRSVIGRSFTGDGQDSKSAIAAAVNAAASEVCRTYSREAGSRADMLSGNYDALMHDNRNMSPDQAIDEVFAKEAAIRATAKKL